MTPSLHLNPDYIANAALVSATILAVQPRNGKPYDSEPDRRRREQIAVNVHVGNFPLEGLV